jgi:N6-adenosine-specific RNA methylase IME4
MNKYQVILADPPWYYNNRKTGGERCNKTKFGGGAMKHYPLMKDAELMAMAEQVKNLADDNCALFMWATMPRLDFAIELLKEWGFRYATTAFVWVKHSAISNRVVFGPGYYTASNCEIVLLGVTGSVPPTEKMVSSVIQSPRERHSSKPIEVRRRIERMYPLARNIELFAREKHTGWDAWGNEVKSDIQLVV